MAIRLILLAQKAAHYKPIRGVTPVMKVAIPLVI